jgi:hypothetical protein
MLNKHKNHIMTLFFYLKSIVCRYLCLYLHQINKQIKKQRKMKTNFLATTRSGKAYNVRMSEIKDLKRAEIGQNGSWDKLAEIEVNGTWYKCLASGNGRDGKFIRCSDAGLLAALGVKGDVCIKCEDWHTIYEAMLEAAIEAATKKASSSDFTYVKFMFHTTHKYMGFKWDAAGNIDFSEKINALKNSLAHINHSALSEFKTGEYDDDYSREIYFMIPADRIDEIIEMSTPNLADAKKAKENAEVAHVVAKEKEANIEAGAVYFHCESAPHDEDLSGVVLNRPAPRSGLFTIEQRLSPELFARIKKFGTYWDREWLDDCDMFYHEEGWRYGEEAIGELLKTNRVFIDGIEVKQEN